MSDTAPQTPTAPAPPTGNATGETPKVFTEEEVQRKLRGQGKQLDDALSRLKAYEEAEAQRKQAAEEKQRKQLEEQGEFKALLEQERKARKAAEDYANKLQGERKQRLEAVEAENKKRFDKLPKHLQKLVPPGLNPDMTREQIRNLEALVGQDIRDVDQGGGRSKGPEDEATKKAKQREEIAKRGRDFVFGGAK